MASAAVTASPWAVFAKAGILARATFAPGVSSGSSPLPHDAFHRSVNLSANENVPADKFK